MFNRFIEKMQTHSIKQDEIICSINILADVLIQINHPIKIDKANPAGACNGLCYAYKFFSHQGKRREFVFTLMKIASCTDKSDWLNLLKEQNKAFFELRNLDTSVIINFKIVITIIQAIQFSQKNQSLTEIGVLVDKTCSFVCHKNNLASRLKGADLKGGDSVLVDMGTHIFYIERSEQGYYLFEPNNIDDNAIYPEIFSINHLADSIIENCKSFLDKDHYIAFNLQFISYQSQNKFSHIDEVILDMINDSGTNLKIQNICLRYRQKKISRLDFILAIIDISKNENLTSKAFIGKLEVIQNAIASESEFLKSSLCYGDINKTAFRSDISLIYLASRHNQLTLLKILLKEKDIDVNIFSNHGMSPLIIAVQEGNFNVAEMLLCHPNIKVNQSNERGITPLYIAVQNGDKVIFNLLLRHGASVDVAIKANPQVLIDQAKKMGKEKQLVDILLLKNDGILPDRIFNFNPFHAALFFGHEELAKHLLELEPALDRPTGRLSSIEIANIMMPQLVDVLTQKSSTHYIFHR